MIGPQVYATPEEWSKAVADLVVRRFGAEGRCHYRRGVSWRELFRLAFGPYTIEDIENSRRCIHSYGHSEQGYPHMTADGKSWWRD